LDTRRILAALLWLSAVALFARPSAEAIYKQSTKVLSFEKIKFQVLAKMHSGAYTQEKRFMIARAGNEQNGKSLICFLSPQNIKGTAILLTKNAKKSAVLVYFPSLGRSRIIPKQQENDEAFGLGLSFSELQNNAENLKFIGQTKEHGKNFYILEKLANNERTLYQIEKKSMLLRKMQIFKDKRLIKAIAIQKSISFQNKELITQWEIIDYIKNKTTHYSVDTNTITTVFSKRIFKKSALSRCRP
jgi:hypothetical protein